MWQPVCKDGGAAPPLAEDAASLAQGEADRSAWCPCPHMPVNIPQSTACSFQHLGVAPTYTWAQIRSNPTETLLHFAGCCDRAEFNLRTQGSTAWHGKLDSPLQGKIRKASLMATLSLIPQSYTGEMNVKIKVVVFDLLNTIHFNSPCQQKVIFSLAIFILSEMGRTH